MKPNSVTIEFASPEDAAQFHRAVSAAFQSALGGPQLSGPKLASAVAAIARAKSYESSANASQNIPTSTDDLRTRFRCFKVSYFGPGAVKGSRIKISDPRHKKSKFIEYADDNQGRAIDQAYRYLLSIGIRIEAMGLQDLDSDILLLSPDFSTPLK